MYAVSRTAAVLQLGLLRPRLREKELESSSNDDSLSSLERFTDEQLLSEVKRRGL